MTNNIHPVVELLAARMESNPEEFPVNPNGQLPIMGRWAPWLAQAEHLMNDAERTLLYTKAKEAVFQRIHEEVLDELMNGPERRAEEQRKRDEEVQRHIALQQAAQQQQLQGYRNAVGQRGAYDYNLDRYQNQLGQAQALGIGTQSPSQPLTIGTGGKEIMRIKADGGVITQPNLSSSAINQIKQALGIKK
jgi:hypothetical protein